MWKFGEVKVKQLDSRYSVGDNGVVYSGGLPLKAVRGEWVVLWGERKSVAYLVARAFLENKECREWVRHKNGDRTDNRACNLEWCEEKEKGLKRGPKPRLVPVVKYDLDGNKLAVYGNVTEAALSSGVKAELIRAALNRGGGRSGGYFWGYL